MYSVNFAKQYLSMLKNCHTWLSDKTWKKTGVMKVFKSAFKNSILTGYLILGYGTT